MFIVPNPNPPFFTDPSFIFRDSRATGTNARSYAFTSLANDNTSATRVVTAFLFFEDPQTITAATIGGVTATIVQAGSSALQMIYAEVPKDTAATTISVTLSGVAGRAGICVYAVTNYQSSTPIATFNNVSTPVSGPLSQNISVIDGDVVLAGASSSTSGATIAWTNLSEDAQENIESNAELSSASAKMLAVNASLAITATISAGNVALLGGIWR